MKATYTATLAAGTWQLLGFVPDSSDYQATTATAHLTASDGPHVATLDETQPGGRFYALGSYHFGGGQVIVEFNDGAAAGDVAFDALRFHALSLDPPGRRMEAGVRRCRERCSD